MSDDPSYAALLAARTKRTGSCLCLGLDPDPTGLPEGFRTDGAGVEAFGTLLLEAALPFASAVKANLAFFEALGSAGLAVLERLRAKVPDDVPFVADGKRGDIGSTSRLHAAALFDTLGVHAVTASPYLGRDALEPLLERSGRCVYVLCRTSNPGASEFQALRLKAGSGEPEEPLYLRVARHAATWAGESAAAVGLVVGATVGDELSAVRTVAPEAPFLVPGVGAQGGDVVAVLTAGGATSGPFASHGGGLLVNVSRGIAGAARDAPDPGAALMEAARNWAVRLRCYDRPASSVTPHEGH